MEYFPIFVFRIFEISNILCRCRICRTVSSALQLWLLSALVTPGLTKGVNTPCNTNEAHSFILFPLVSPSCFSYFVIVFLYPAAIFITEYYLNIALLSTYRLEHDYCLM